MALGRGLTLALEYVGSPGGRSMVGGADDDGVARDRDRVTKAVVGNGVGTTQYGRPLPTCGRPSEQECPAVDQDGGAPRRGDLATRKQQSGEPTPSFSAVPQPASDTKFFGWCWTGLDGGLATELPDQPTGKGHSAGPPALDRRSPTRAGPTSSIASLSSISSNERRSSSATSCFKRR